VVQLRVKRKISGKSIPVSNVVFEFVDIEGTNNKLVLLEK
jgi:hypothetical protein